MEKYEWKEDRIVEGIEPFIYLTANKFYLTAKGLGSYFTEPIVVNLSFSIELYLKCLSTKSTYSKKKDTNLPVLERKLETLRVKGKGSHELIKIFNLLKEEEKNQLIKQYLEKYQEQLEEDLTEISNAFINYRYSFEKDFLTINLTILNRIALFLKEYIENEMKQGKFYR